MAHIPGLTPKEILLFSKLLRGKFSPETKEKIARDLHDGSHASTSTRQFVDKMINFSFLTLAGFRMIKVGNRQVERPVYGRNEKWLAEAWQKIKEKWKQTDEFGVSYQILDEEAVIIK